MNRIRKFMYGRYGFDQFSQGLVIASIITSLIGSLFRISVFVALSYLPLLYAIYRMISKDINKRTQENMRYTNIMNSWKSKFRKSKLRLKGTKTHKYYKCPTCNQTIRIPKGKGKICITCPKCKAEFIRRS